MSFSTWVFQAAERRRLLFFVSSCQTQAFVLPVERSQLQHLTTVRYNMNVLSGVLDGYDSRVGQRERQSRKQTAVFYLKSRQLWLRRIVSTVLSDFFVSCHFHIETNDNVIEALSTLRTGRNECMYRLLLSPAATAG